MRGASKFFSPLSQLGGPPSIFCLWLAYKGSLRVGGYRGQQLSTLTAELWYRVVARNLPYVSTDGSELCWSSGQLLMCWLEGSGHSFGFMTWRHWSCDYCLTQLKMMTNLECFSGSTMSDLQEQWQVNPKAAWDKWSRLEQDEAQSENAFWVRKKYSLKNNLYGKALSCLR